MSNDPLLKSFAEPNSEFMRIKNIFFSQLAALLLLCSTSVQSQDHLLEVEGAIELSNTIDPNPDPGTIRWNGQDFEGWDGQQWLSLTNGVKTITDIDNNRYEIVTIGSQTWMRENLATTRYNDGTAIPYVRLAADWAALSSPGFAWYDNTRSEYGALYNYYVVADTNSRNVCPVGWHVPTDAEWTTLSDFLGGVSVAGGKMREAGYSHWQIVDDFFTTNESGFTGLPGGWRWEDGVFIGIHSDASYWSSTEISNSESSVRLLGESDELFVLPFDKKAGVSVRCLKDKK